MGARDVGDQGARRAWSEGLTGAREGWWDRVVVAMDAGARGGAGTARASGGVEECGGVRDARALGGVVVHGGARAARASGGVAARGAEHGPGGRAAGWMRAAEHRSRGRAAGWGARTGSWGVREIGREVVRELGSGGLVPLFGEYGAGRGGLALEFGEYAREISPIAMLGAGESSDVQRTQVEPHLASVVCIAMANRSKNQQGAEFGRNYATRKRGSSHMANASVEDQLNAVIERFQSEADQRALRILVSVAKAFSGTLRPRAMSHPKPHEFRLEFSAEHFVNIVPSWGGRSGDHVALYCPKARLSELKASIVRHFDLTAGDLTAWNQNVPHTDSQNIDMTAIHSKKGLGALVAVMGWLAEEARPSNKA